MNQIDNKMKMISSRVSVFFKILLLSGLLLGSLNTLAAQVSQEAFIDKMVSQHGFDRYQLMSLLEKAKVKKSILKLMYYPPKKKRKRRYRGKPWYKYRRNFLSSQSINRGIDFWRQNASALERAQRTYGVPAEIIVAIIGVETRYGRIMGNFRVIDALKTLAFHYPRRADFFQEELEHYLLFTLEEGRDPLKQKGSYAGAMGLGQFMPSSYRRYAVDFDGDGERDIWTNTTDAIGSVANYFRSFGWKTGEPVIKATQVRPNAVESLLTQKFNTKSERFKPRYPLWQLKQKGALYHGDEPNDMLGRLIDLRTEIGTAYWLGFQNYYVITRYNNSKHYAMAVYQLAQEIANGYAESD